MIRVVVFFIVACTFARRAATAIHGRRVRDLFAINPIALDRPRQLTFPIADGLSGTLCGDEAAAVARRRRLRVDEEARHRQAARRRPRLRVGSEVAGAAAERAGGVREGARGARIAGLLASFALVLTRRALRARRGALLGRELSSAAVVAGGHSGVGGALAWLTGETLSLPAQAPRAWRASATGHRKPFGVPAGIALRTFRRRHRHVASAVTSGAGETFPAHSGWCVSPTLARLDSLTKLLLRKVPESRNCFRGVDTRRNGHD